MKQMAFQAENNQKCVLNGAPPWTPLGKLTAFPRVRINGFEGPLPLV